MTRSVLVLIRVVRGPGYGRGRSDLSAPTVGVLHDHTGGVPVAEVLVEFDDAVMSEDGKNYTARACGAEMPGGTWQGWIEFIPLGKGEPIRSSRETTQPNRLDTVYWATGLTFIYLEGALHRALTRVRSMKKTRRSSKNRSRRAQPGSVERHARPIG